MIFKSSTDKSLMNEHLMRITYKDLLLNEDIIRVICIVDALIPV